MVRHVYCRQLCKLILLYFVSESWFVFVPDWTACALVGLVVNSRMRLAMVCSARPVHWVDSRVVAVLWFFDV